MPDNTSVRRPFISAPSMSQINPEPADAVSPQIWRDLALSILMVFALALIVGFIGATATRG
jgi:hypothetical protein